jgi:DNA replication protein DnaC
MGIPALGRVETVDGIFLKGVAAILELKARLRASRQVVLLGKSRVGKSISIAAYADTEIRAGAERVRWMSPFAIRDSAIDRALGAKTLIIDDIGEEVATASEDTGLSAQRVAPLAEVMAALARSRGKKLIVTTFMDRKRMDKHYGGGVAARVFDGADVVRLHHHQDEDDEEATALDHSPE